MTVVSLDKVREFRARADECDVRARLAQTEAVRRDYRDLAKQWRQLAEQSKKTEADRGGDQ